MCVECTKIFKERSGTMSLYAWLWCVSVDRMKIVKKLADAKLRFFSKFQWILAYSCRKKLYAAEPVLCPSRQFHLQMVKRVPPVKVQQFVFLLSIFKGTKMSWPRAQKIYQLLSWYKFSVCQCKKIVTQWLLIALSNTCYAMSNQIRLIHKLSMKPPLSLVLKSLKLGPSYRQK
jgi:hypothetical protein